MKKCLFLLSFMLVLMLVIASSLGVTLASTEDLGPSQSNQPSVLISTSGDAPQKAARTEEIIADHNTTDITAIPQYWIEEAKRILHIAYGHTSHGSQLTTGMTGLVGFANNGGLGLALPQDIFDWNNGGTDGALDLHDGAMEGDVGYYPQWVNNTTSYLGTPDPTTGRGANHPDVNVIIWSWCGQASDRTEQEMIDTYLAPMTQLEVDYPGITFIYMTGHADGSGESGDLHLRNQQIRDYCTQNNKVLFDFYDIELYDPDGNYFGDKDVEDDCDYDSDGNGSRDANWATEWQDSHTQNDDWYSCVCAHSIALNCNQKAYAVWWLWARLAGWDDLTGEAVDLEPSHKTVSSSSAGVGDRLDYTVVIRNGPGPIASTILLTDTIPDGLDYVPGSLTVTSGVSDTSQLPSLYWTGVLSPTPAVTLTYAATVTEVDPNTLTNTAVIALPGEQSVPCSATVIINGSAVYLPLTMK